MAMLQECEDGFRFVAGAPALIREMLVSGVLMPLS